MEAETKDANQLAEMLQKIPDKERETILHMVKGIELVNSCKEAETKSA